MEEVTDLKRSWKLHWVLRICDRLRKQIGDKAFKMWFGES